MLPAYDYQGYTIDYTIGDFGFVGTCGSHPCQYDVVYLQKDQPPWQVGYVRLRGGKLKAYFPDVGGHMVYYYDYDDCKFRGDFIDEEDRIDHLELIAVVLQKKLDAISYGYS